MHVGPTVQIANISIFDQGSSPDSWSHALIQGKREYAAEAHAKVSSGMLSASSAETPNARSRDLQVGLRSLTALTRA